MSRYKELPWSVEDTIENLEIIKEHMEKTVIIRNLHGRGEKDAEEVRFDFDRAINALKENQQYRQIGTLEECREARERQQAVPARKTTIFEGKDAEKLAAKGLPNYETYKCPKCGRIVVESTAAKSLHPDGFMKKNYCEKCGQAIDWSAE